MKITRTTFLMGALGLGLASRVRAQSDIVYDLLPTGAPRDFISGNGRITWGGTGAQLKRWELGNGVTTYNIGVASNVAAGGISRGADAVAIDEYVWQESTGAVALSVPAGYGGVRAVAVSRNRNKVGGYVTQGTLHMPCLWENGAPTLLGVLPEYQSGDVVDMSKDGTALTGVCVNQWNYQAYYWTPTHMEQVRLEGYWHTLPHAISDDGQAVVGIAYTENWSSLTAFVWRNGIEGAPVGAGAVTAVDVSEDGQVIVGHGFPGAYFWNASLGVTGLENYLVEQGVGLKDSDIHEITRVSADGTTIIGRAVKDGVSRTFRARHPDGWQSAL